MPWVFLLVAGVLEVAWSVGMKYAATHPRWWPLLMAFAVSIGSILCLMQAMKDLPLGTSYVVWTGIGAVGAALCGMLLFQESTSLMRFLWMALVVAGILGLKWTT